MSKIEITKREHFAALALQGLCVNFGRNGFTELTAPAAAVKFADCLIKELNKTEITIHGEPEASVRLDHV